MSRSAAHDEARDGAVTIFRREAAPLHQAGPQGGLTEASRAGLAGLVEAGMAEGAESRVLFDEPGFSLMYVWFKSGFPLYRHSHGPDCLYQVIGGSVRLDDQLLRKGDGFFVPGGTAYSFEVGPDGVEILEFRHEHIRDTVVQGASPAFWERAIKTVEARRKQWRSETRPV